MPFYDNIADAYLLPADSGTFGASMAGATYETGEPWFGQYDGSVWLKLVPTVDGLLTIDCFGTDWFTIQESPVSSPTMADLTEVAENNLFDYPYRAQLAQGGALGVLAGHFYFIQILKPADSTTYSFSWVVSPSVSRTTGITTFNPEQGPDLGGAFADPGGPDRRRFVMLSDYTGIAVFVMWPGTQDPVTLEWDTEQPQLYAVQFTIDPVAFTVTWGTPALVYGIEYPAVMEGDVVRYPVHPSVTRIDGSRALVWWAGQDAESKAHRDGTSVHFTSSQLFLDTVPMAAVVQLGPTLTVGAHVELRDPLHDPSYDTWDGALHDMAPITVNPAMETVKVIAAVPNTSGGIHGVAVVGTSRVSGGDNLAYQGVTITGTSLALEGAPAITAFADPWTASLDFSYGAATGVPFFVLVTDAVGAPMAYYMHDTGTAMEIIGTDFGIEALDHVAASTVGRDSNLYTYTYSNPAGGPFDNHFSHIVQENVAPIGTPLNRTLDELSVADRDIYRGGWLAVDSDELIVLAVIRATRVGDDPLTVEAWNLQSGWPPSTYMASVDLDAAGTVDATHHAAFWVPASLHDGFADNFVVIWGSGLGDGRTFKSVFVQPNFTTGPAPPPPPLSTAGWTFGAVGF